MRRAPQVGANHWLTHSDGHRRVVVVRAFYWRGHDGKPVAICDADSVPSRFTVALSRIEEA